LLSGSGKLNLQIVKLFPKTGPQILLTNQPECDSLQTLDLPILGMDSVVDTKEACGSFS
jgi:hypothetical protein